MLAVLARRCGWLAQDEREAVFHDAYALMLEKEQRGDLDSGAMHVNQVRAYLTQTAINKALDEGKRAERQRTEPIGDRALTQEDPAVTPEDAASSHMEGATAREIVAELPARRQAVVKLRFFFERSPEEIQRMLHISPRTYRRELERGLRHVAGRYELVRSGRFCETRRDLILAYVAGSADPRAAAEAKTHLANCPGCTHWAAELRRAAEDVAAVVPLPVMLGAYHLDRIGDAVGAGLEVASEAAAWTKQQVVGILTRVDPAAISFGSGARPGTVATVVAGCIAVGGGATYCAVEGVNTPIGSLLGKDHPPRSERANRTTTSKPESEPRPPSKTVAAETPVAKPPAPKQQPEEFTPEGAGPTAAPGGEFGPTRSGAGSGSGSGGSGSEFGP